MTKRAYPFVDCSPLQLKTHVGPKQLNGVSGDQFKREIFEKTKQLLFSGAQTYMDRMWSGSKSVSCAALNSSDRTVENTNARDSCGDHGLLQGQTLIGHDGKLLKCSNDHRKTLLPKISPACTSCVKSVGHKEACTQCERFICMNCRVCCSCCWAVTCSLCSVVDDGDNGETVFCYGCSLFEVSH